MPVFRDTDMPPAWCELEGFEILRLETRARRSLPRLGRRGTLFVGGGACTVGDENGPRRASAGDVLDLPDGTGGFQVAALDDAATLVYAWGRWSESTGASGVFTLDNSPTPRNTGDPAPYPRQTDFDRHYHDCDEYWILYGGRGLVVSEGCSYTVGAGDCVATGRGHHHDFPMVIETVRAVYLETTLEGLKRPGHLWEHTHGPASPLAERR